MPASTINASARDHAGQSDLAAMLSFASAAMAERQSQRSTWHPGDLLWAFKDDFYARRDIRIWFDGDAAVAMAWFVAPGALWMEVRPAWEPLVADILAWAEDALRSARPRLGKRHLSIRAFDTDERRISALEQAGYSRAAPESVHFQRVLDAQIAAPELPEGFDFVDCIDVDSEARAACHRDAWNHLEHLGIEATSTFSAQTYARLAAAPVYDPSLDLMIQSPDGRLVCNTIAWSDLASRVGKFEPVGTHHEFRGLGLARAITQEGCRRLRDRGHLWAQVGTAHFNAPAIATYRASGFAPHCESAWWTRMLDEYGR